MEQDLENILWDSDKKYRLAGMYKDWFLEFASYSNLDRAVPYLSDGLKPVQRRVLHSMKEMEDGRYNKVAGIIGHTMQYHPHGDRSIGDALVQLGQKELLIDTQGNWGNILTGDRAAAPRYIEARLTKFALDVVFNDKTTEWTPSYDGRHKEPVSLPIKFPLLLAQGTDGIGVGLKTSVLPHNFNELIDASIATLKGEDFILYPDFPTGGLADVSNYNHGLQGGRVRVRARIVKIDKKTLAITELPYGEDTSTIMESIEKANQTGKIKVRKVENNTAEKAEILVHLANDVSPDITIDALYAFTNCQTSLAPDTCVIKDRKPVILTVEEILKHNTQNTVDLLTKELEIRKGELEQEWFFTSLEMIFFEEKIYRLLENKESKSWDAQLHEILTEMKKYQERLNRQIHLTDIEKLVEKPVRKISKFDLKKAEKHIKDLEDELKSVKYNLEHIIEYAINYYQGLKDKYGKGRERRTEICSFETIAATKVAFANSKLYVNKAEGFIGTNLKKDDNAEYIGECSEIDDIIVFLKSGEYIITKVQPKAFIGKDIIHAAVFKKNDDRTIYNAIYRNGAQGYNYVKRFAVTGITRDKTYNITQGEEKSQVLWFTANANGEAETVKVFLKGGATSKKLILEYQFAQLAIKGRSSRGNLLTKHPVQKVTLKEKGIATLKGKDIWFDTDVQRLNDDGRGDYLGAFDPEDKILAINKNGTFVTTGFELTNKYQDEIFSIEKHNPDTIYSIIYIDGETGLYYVKRCKMSETNSVVTCFISESEGSSFVALSNDLRPQLLVTFGGKNASRAPETINVEEFIGEKSFKAKGKRVSQYEISKVEFIEPLPSDDIVYDMTQSEEPEPDDSNPNTNSNSEDNLDIPEDAIQMTLL